ncbi:MAG: O-antigen ligase family protein [Patescibacteria group bacterium]|nr:O-antigen ligase family protein [Candidatus Beckwithbacteria bacterium]MDZ4228991.1 O-antigen ligase family protein [Patescibacteria group bacterium]
MIAAAFYVLFIVVPLILTPWNYELFEFNKMLAVYGLTVIIAALWVIEMIRQKKWLCRRTPFDIPLMLFLASQILATVFSIDRHTSIWGYYSRFHGGLMSTVSYLVLYYAFVTFMRHKLKPVLAVMLSTATIVSLYGIAERLGIDKSLWVQDVQNRVFSTLGQPNWLAAYLLALTPLAWQKKSLLGYVYSLIFFVTILFTRSRSGLFGFAVAFTVYWALILLKNKLANFPWKQFLILSCASALTVLIFSRDLLPTLAQPTTGLAEETAPAVSVGGSASSDIRKVVWEGAVNIWKHYPMFGSGVETFAYAYYNFRPIEHNLLSEWDFLYNKAHNEFLNFLATTGAFGLGSYLLLILWFSVYTLKTNQPALLAGYLGMAVSNFFGFSVVPVALLFFLYPAIAEAKAGKSALGQAKYFPLNNFRAVLISLTALLALFGWLLIGRMWRADYLFNLGRNQVKARLLQEGWQNLSRAVQLAPTEPVFRNDLAEAEAQLAYAYSSPSAQLSKQFSDQALRDADLVMQANPVNLNFYRSRIKILLTLAAVNPDYYSLTLEAFDRAIALAPTDAKLTYNLGLVYNQLGQTGLAEQLLVKTIELKPNYEAARNSLGSLYEQTQRPELAREQYQYILEFLNPGNTVVKNRLELL